MDKEKLFLTILLLILLTIAHAILLCFLYFIAIGIYAVDTIRDKGSECIVDPIAYVQERVPENYECACYLKIIPNRRIYNFSLID